MRCAACAQHETPRDTQRTGVSRLLGRVAQPRAHAHAPYAKMVALKPSMTLSTMGWMNVTKMSFCEYLLSMTASKVQRSGAPHTWLTVTVPSARSTSTACFMPASNSLRFSGRTRTRTLIFSVARLSRLRRSTTPCNDRLLTATSAASQPDTHTSSPSTSSAVSSSSLPNNSHTSVRSCDAVSHVTSKTRVAPLRSSRHRTSIFLLPCCVHAAGCLLGCEQHLKVCYLMFWPECSNAQRSWLCERMSLPSTKPRQDVVSSEYSFYSSQRWCVCVCVLRAKAQCQWAQK